MTEYKLEIERWEGSGQKWYYKFILHTCRYSEKLSIEITDRDLDFLSDILRKLDVIKDG